MLENVDPYHRRARLRVIAENVSRNELCQFFLPKITNAITILEYVEFCCNLNDVTPGTLPDTTKLKSTLEQLIESVADISA